MYVHYILVDSTVSDPSLIAPCTVLSRSDLVHLGDSLLELIVLAFFVGMSLVLASYQLLPSE